MTERDRKLRARKRALRKRSIPEIENLIQELAERVIIYRDIAGACAALENFEIGYEAACIVLAEKLNKSDASRQNPA